MTATGASPSAPPASGTGRAHRMPHLPGLDGLRGLAVIGVLLFHGGFAWAKGGFLGVSTFFTLSGFLITNLLIREWDGSGTIRLGGFWTRRFRRLLPAAMVTIVAVGLVFWRLGTPEQLANLRADMISSLAYVANWHFLFAGTSYADLFSAPSPLQHFWSLAIEEQFYLVFPLLVLGRHQGGRAPPARRRAADAHHRLGRALESPSAPTSTASTTAPTPGRPSCSSAPCWRCGGRGDASPPTPASTGTGSRSAPTWPARVALVADVRHLGPRLGDLHHPRPRRLRRSTPWPPPPSSSPPPGPGSSPGPCRGSRCAGPGSSATACTSTTGRSSWCSAPTGSAVPGAAVRAAHGRHRSRSRSSRTTSSRCRSAGRGCSSPGSRRCERSPSARSTAVCCAVLVTTNPPQSQVPYANAKIGDKPMVVATAPVSATTPRHHRRPLGVEHHHHPGTQRRHGHDPRGLRHRRRPARPRRGVLHLRDQDRSSTAPRPGSGSPARCSTGAPSGPRRSPSTSPTSW